MVLVHLLVDLDANIRHSLCLHHVIIHLCGLQCMFLFVCLSYWFSSCPCLWL